MTPAGIPHGCHEPQRIRHSQDEVAMSQGPSSQAPTLPPIQQVIQVPPSQDVFQRVRAAPNPRVRPSSPSTQATQRGSRPTDIQDLLNPEGDDHANAGFGGPGGTNPAPPQPASQSDSPSTQYSAYSQANRTESTIAPPAAFISMPQSPFSNAFPSSRPAFGTESQYQMMALDTENGPIQVPLNVQAASKVADEKRKRNATASHRFRQRRKEKEREYSQKISELEQQVREIAEEREFYRGERDYFRTLVTRFLSQDQLLPRPLSPRQRRLHLMGRSDMAVCPFKLDRSGGIYPPNPGPFDPYVPCQPRAARPT